MSGMAETILLHVKQARILEGQAFVYCIHTTAGITIPYDGGNNYSSHSRS
ncbi:hypothetical protein ACLBWT_09580 [Paenibacillus sp. D51F]